jgi:hypothetical protein
MALFSPRDKKGAAAFWKKKINPFLLGTGGMDSTTTALAMVDMIAERAIYAIWMKDL